MDHRVGLLSSFKKRASHVFERCQRLGAVTLPGSRHSRAGRQTRLRTHARTCGPALLAMASCYQALACNSHTHARVQHAWLLYPPSLSRRYVHVCVVLRSPLLREHCSR